MEENRETGKAADKRRHLREPIIVFKIREEENQQFFFGYARNISRSGFFIASINPREPGDRFHISFQIPKTDIRASCQCEVVWLRKYKPGSTLEPGYGIKFIDLPEDIAEAIDKWVSKEVINI